MQSDFGSVTFSASEGGFRQNTPKPSPSFQEFVDTSALEALHRCRPRGYLCEASPPSAVAGFAASENASEDGDAESQAHASDLAPRVREGLALLVEIAEEWKRQSAVSVDGASQTRFARVQLEGLHSIRKEYMDDFMRYFQSLDAMLGRLHDATNRQKEGSPGMGGE